MLHRDAIRPWFYRSSISARDPNLAAERAVALDVYVGLFEGQPLDEGEFLVCADDQAALEALRYARRSMLREELTLGRESGEPSLEAAVFSAVEIAWTVPRSRREWCLKRLEELERRANRTLVELRRR